MVFPDLSDHRRALLFGGAALCSVALMLIVYMFCVREPTVPPYPSPRIEEKARSRVMPATTASPASELVRDPASVTPVANWHSNLTEEQRALCLELLKKDDIDVVLVRVISTSSYSTLWGEAHREFRVRVLDGSEKLNLVRHSDIDACIRVGHGCRELAVGEVCFAFIANSDPVAKVIGLPPRLRMLEFAGPALPESVAMSTDADADAKAQASPAPVVGPSTWQRWLQGLKQAGKKQAGK